MSASTTMMTKEELLRTPAGSAAFAELTAEITALKKELADSRFECEHKEREFWRIQRICAETGQRCDAEIREMRKACEAMRMEKFQIERGLAMLGTDDPTNVVQRLNKELEETREKLAQKTSEASLLAASLACCDKERVAELEKLLHEGREQAQAEVYELRREHEAVVDGYHGEIYDLERQLDDARTALADSSMEYAAQSRSLKEAKARIAELERQLEESDHRRIVLEGSSAEEIRTLKARLATEERHAEDLNTQLFHKDEELMALRGQMDQTSAADLDYIADLNREVSEYADTVDDLQRQLRAHQSEIARKEQVILRLTRERNVWRNRHEAVTQSAHRLRKELDEAYAAAAEPSKTVSPPLNPDAPEFVPSSSLNPDAPEYLPVVEGLKEAVQKRLAEKAAAEETARKATVESFKDAIRARLATAAVAEKPALTISEVSIPDYKVNWLAYKEHCVTTIQGLLNECAAAVGSANKVPAAVRMFSFIKEHGMPFLRAYKKLRLTVLSKCWEFKAEERSTAELRTLSDWMLEQFKDEHPRLSYGCGTCSECFKALAIAAMNVSRALPPATNPDLTAIGLAPSTERADGRHDLAASQTPIKRVPAPTPLAPAAPQKRHRTRTRTGAIPRRNYAEESDSE